MQPTTDSIYEAALKLSEQERFDLATRLMDTLPDELGLLSMDDPNLIEKLDQRAADDSATIPWSELRKE